MKTDTKSIERRQRAFLKNCWLDGQYIVEHVTDFWSRMDSARCLAGERLMVCCDTVCKPLEFTGKALLVCHTDQQGKEWYSWIHS